MVAGLEYMLSQYADDMSVATLSDESSVKTVFEKLEWFRRNTGFQLSYEKTTIYRLGSIHNTNAMYYAESGVQWTNDPVSILGIKVGYNEDNRSNTDLNYEPLFQRIQAILSSWRCRNLSLFGKVSIINTLVASLFVYKMQVLEALPTALIIKFEKEMCSFIWNGNKPKISMATLKTSKKCGGLALVDLAKKDAALKISWIKVLDQDEKLSAYRWKNNLLEGRVSNGFDNRKTIISRW